MLPDITLHKIHDISKPIIDDDVDDDDDEDSYTPARAGYPTRSSWALEKRSLRLEMFLAISYIWWLEDYTFLLGRVSFQGLCSTSGGYIIHRITIWMFPKIVG